MKQRLSLHFGPERYLLPPTLFLRPALRRDSALDMSCKTSLTTYSSLQTISPDSCAP